MKKRRLAHGEPGSGNYIGSWGKDKEEEELDKKIEEEQEKIREQYEAEQREKEQKEKEKAEKEKEKREAEGSIEEITKEEQETLESEGKSGAKLGCEVSSVYHGKQLYDYQGRSYVSPPSYVKPHEHDCFLPKRIIHTWSGHLKGISSIKLFPRYGHLLLSGSKDGKVKIWDVYNERKCLRTYMGHTLGIQDVDFSPDGKQFLSSGLDKVTRLWDTETGQVICSFTNGRVYNQVRFHPHQQQHGDFLAAANDKKVYQWDMATGKFVITYGGHMGPVNTVTFLEDGKRIATTSDDKSIRFWDYGIPACVKHYTEAHMTSMPSVAVHPNGKYLAAQSLDNQILVFEAMGKFRINTKKRFVGHEVSGYGCQIGFSPDGKYLISGDSTGGLNVWDWKSSKLYKYLASFTLPFSCQSHFHISTHPSSLCAYIHANESM